MRMIETPVSASPARIAWAIGDAPRQRGSRDAWTLTAPKRRGIDAARREDLAVRGDDHAIRDEVEQGPGTTSGAPIFAGISTGSPSSRAASATGRGAGLPRFPSRSARVTTASDLVVPGACPERRHRECRGATEDEPHTALTTPGSSASSAGSTSRRVPSFTLLVKRMPSRWSSSCCTARASRPSPLTRTSLP